MLYKKNKGCHINTLIIAILCSASIALLFKYSASKSLDRNIITFTNYLTAVIITFIWNQTKIINLDSIPKFPLIIGFFTGLFFLLSFILYQKSVRNYGAGVSSMFAKLGILVPMLLSIIFWKEFPSLIQWIGITIAISAIGLSVVEKKNLKCSLQPLLIGLFLGGGFAEFLNKIFEQYGSPDNKYLFLLSVFSTALISSGFVQNKKSKFDVNSVIVGILVGIPNLFSSYFILLSLEKLPAAVVFPIYSSGSIAIISIGSFLIFRENIDSKKWFAIALSIIALVLINL